MRRRLLNGCSPIKNNNAVRETVDGKALIEEGREVTFVLDRDDSSW